MASFVYNTSRRSSLPKHCFCHLFSQEQLGDSVRCSNAACLASANRKLEKKRNTPTKLREREVERGGGERVRNDLKKAKELKLKRILNFD